MMETLPFAEEIEMWDATRTRKIEAGMDVEIVDTHHSDDPNHCCYYVGSVARVLRVVCAHQIVLVNVIPGGMWYGNTVLRVV